MKLGLARLFNKKKECGFKRGNKGRKKGRAKRKWSEVSSR
jgi:hypothetical protein